MKRRMILFSLICVCLAASGTAFGQKGCEFNIVGTWKVASPEGASHILYRFAPDGTVAVLSDPGAGSQAREIATATYKLNYDPELPGVLEAISFTAASGDAVFAKGMTSMEVTKYDDTSLTCVRPGSGPTVWVRVEPYRYFMILAGRIGTFYDGSGPTFPMMVKTDGQQTQIDAVGIYDVKGHWAFGTIPAETYGQFMKEPRKDSEVLLRLEITGAQYERGLKIVRTWQRRARENTLLYPDLPMDNILLVKQVTESLNQCGEKFKLYKLDWSLNDHISSSSLRDDNALSRTPFLYFKELRRLNESLHVGDEKFYEQIRLAHQRSGQ
jgi:hypothetical protein